MKRTPETPPIGAETERLERQFEGLSHLIQAEIAGINEQILGENDQRQKGILESWKQTLTSKGREISSILEIFQAGQVKNAREELEERFLKISTVLERIQKSRLGEAKKNTLPIPKKEIPKAPAGKKPKLPKAIGQPWGRQQEREKQVVDLREILGIDKPPMAEGGWQAEVQTLIVKLFKTVEHEIGTESELEFKARQLLTSLLYIRDTKLPDKNLLKKINAGVLALTQEKNSDNEIS